MRRIAIPLTLLGTEEEAKEFPPATGRWDKAHRRVLAIDGWADEYKRILTLFEDNLRTPGSGKAAD